MAIPTIHYLEPAYSLIETLGGKSSVSKALGLTPSALSRWCQPKPRGTGGSVPQRHWFPLIDLGKKRGIKLRVDDLIGNVQP